MDKPREWYPPPPHLFKDSLPYGDIQFSSKGPMAFMIDHTIIPSPTDCYTRCSHTTRQMEYDITTKTISFLFGSHPCWSLVIINVNTKKIVYSRELDTIAPSMCLVPGILLLFNRSEFYYVNLASASKEKIPFKVCDLDRTLYLRSDFNDIKDPGSKTLSGVVEARYLGNNLVCVRTRSSSSVIKVILASDKRPLCLLSMVRVRLRLRALNFQKMVGKSLLC